MAVTKIASDKNKQNKNAFDVQLEEWQTVCRINRNLGALITYCTVPGCDYNQTNLSNLHSPGAMLRS